MPAPKVCVFPDTNLSLHYRPLNEIDWCSLLGVKALEIEIAPVVTRELEKHKAVNPSQKLRDRADNALRLLHKYLDNPQLQTGVTLRFLLKEPTAQTAPSRSLNLQLGDDWLIGALLLYRDDNPDTRCVIATADLTLQVKARHYEIEVFTPEDTLRLPSEPDPLEKKNKQLEAELLRYKSREPLLDIHFFDGTNHQRFHLSQPNTKFDPEPEIQSKLAAARAKCQPVELRPKQEESTPTRPDTPWTQVAESMGQVTKGFQEFGRQFYEDHNTRVAAYHHAYEIYLRDSIAFTTLPARTITLELEVGNTGTCPAEDIYLLLHFPDGFTLYDDKNPPREPKEPVVPSKEMNLGISMLRTPNFDFSRIPTFQNPALPSIRKTNSYEVTFEYKKLQHGFIWKLAPLYVAFDSLDSAKSFSFSYSIHASNMIDEKEGPLSVIIEKEPS